MKRNRIRFLSQIGLITLIVLFSSLYLSIASDHSLLIFNQDRSTVDLLGENININTIAQINYRVENNSFDISIRVTIPIIYQDGQEIFLNLTGARLDILYITELNIISNFTIEKVCSGSECSEFVYNYETNLAEQKSLIYTRMLVFLELRYDSDLYKIYFETDNLSYMKESALIIGFTILTALLVILVFVSYYKRRTDFPNIQNDEHFQIHFLLEHFIRKRLLLKVAMLFPLFGFIVYEHNPQLFDTLKWYTTDIVFYSTTEFNGYEFFIMIILYLFVELAYFGVVYWKDDDLRQWISFIDSDKELDLSIRRIFIHPIYSIIFPLLLIILYHQICADCGEVRGNQPRIGDYSGFIEVLRIQIGFFLILLYTQYAKTRAR